MKAYRKATTRLQEKEGCRPPGTTGEIRQHFRKVPPGIYENSETGKVIIIVSDSEYYLGHIRIRQGKYKYAAWRQGKKIKEKYLPPRRTFSGTKKQNRIRQVQNPYRKYLTPLNRK